MEVYNDESVQNLSFCAPAIVDIPEELSFEDQILFMQEYLTELATNIKACRDACGCHHEKRMEYYTAHHINVNYTLATKYLKVLCHKKTGTDDFRTLFNRKINYVYQLPVEHRKQLYLKIDVPDFMQCALETIGKETCTLAANNPKYIKKTRKKSLPKSSREFAETLNTVTQLCGDYTLTQDDVEYLLGDKETMRKVKRIK